MKGWMIFLSALGVALALNELVAWLTYAINPCTEAAARTAIERTSARPLILISAPSLKLEAVPDDPDDDEDPREYSEGDDPEDDGELIA